MSSQSANIKQYLYHQKTMSNGVSTTNELSYCCLLRLVSVFNPLFHTNFSNNQPISTQMLNSLTIALIFLLQFFISNTRNISPSSYFNDEQLGTPPSITSLFFDIPTNQQLIELIQSADIGRILKLIQLLDQTRTQQCSEIISYLAQIHGAIEYIQGKKQGQLSGLQRSIQLAQQQIEAINDEIERINGWQTILQLSTDRMQLNDKLNNLTRLYNVYNQLDDSIGPQTAKIYQYEQEISSIQKSNEMERERLLMEELRLVEIQNNIESLSKQLKKENQMRNQAKDRIWAIKKTINENQIKVATIKNIIANVRRTIEGIQNRAFSLKISYVEAEREAEKLSKQIQSIEEKQDELTSTIRDYEAQKRQLQAKLRYYQFDTLQFEISQLRGLPPTVQQQIQIEYQRCFINKFPSTKIIKLNGKTLYVFQGMAFNNYIQELYGEKMEHGQKLRLLSKIDIYGKQWVSAYGSPSVALQYLDLLFPTYEEKLICGQYQKVVIGHGKIQKLKDFRIVVAGDNRDQINLVIGPCSLLESSRKMPEIGQSIYWKGVEFGQIDNHINMYWGTIY